MNVHLAVPDLLWPDRDSRAAADPGRFAALEMLLARGRRASTPVGGFEQWLLAAWKTTGPASHALVADGGVPGDGWWLRADPCSLRLNRETVVPLDAAMFELPRTEADALAGHLNRHLGERGLAFHPLQPERWYLRAQAPLGEHAPPLAVARGKAIGVHPGAGAEEARLHALANEIQMLLHDHPVNEAREGRGEPPINAVWLWGGGRLERPTVRPFQRVRGQDPLAAGLALGSGAAVLPLPEDAARWLRASGNEGVELIVIDALRAPAAYGDEATWRERVAGLERDWFAPLARALRQGRIGMVTLHAIGAASALDVETTRQDLRYFWRRLRPLASYA
ncbi:MAG TPA: hypothetical protein VML91_18035 [Burkholderiales bacterium]|nr:hypothetical protein [Burkholderiales bacterium]